jgi:hypothetical protein
MLHGPYRLLGSLRMPPEARAANDHVIAALGPGKARHQQQADEERKANLCEPSNHATGGRCAHVLVNGFKTMRVTSELLSFNPGS